MVPGARGSGDGAGSIGRRANSEGLAAQTGSMGKPWSLEFSLRLGVCTLSNKQL